MLQPILFLLQYWPSRASKVDDFLSSERAYAISYYWLIVSLALSLTVSKIRAFIVWNIPLKTAAKLLQMETWLLLTAYRKSSVLLFQMVPSSTPYDLLFSHNTARLAYHSALW